jgi:membrane protease YdiL (CAAX protease family)
MFIPIAQNRVQISESTRRIGTFIGLTFALSAIVWVLMAFHVGSNLLLTGVVMWCPGVASLLTRFIYQRDFSGINWKAGKWRYLLLGAALPLMYSIITYGVTWLMGLGTLNVGIVRQVVSSFDLDGQPINFLAGFFVFYGVVAIGVSIFSAAGEEIGWRGLLVPELTKTMSFRGTALVSGIIWSVWHYPLIIMGGENSGVPLWYGLLCFTIMITSMGVILAWLRLDSHVLWPAVLLHASHNLLLEQVFNPLTSGTGITNYIIDETGIGLAAVTCLLALGIFLWRRAAHRDL